MKKMHLKLIAIVLMLMMVLGMFSACGNNAASETDINEMVNAAVQAAMESSGSAAALTVEVDGRQISFEDTEGKSIQQLLEQADITLNDGDILSVAPYQTLSGGIVIQVMRKTSVTIAVTSGDEEVLHTVELLNGTVADALAAIGLEISDELLVNYAPDQLLKEGMEIVVTSEAEPEETEPEATEPPKSSSSNKTNSSSGSNSGSNSNSNSGKTVVSVEYYEDCDGSGHGVKVITYSDGTQEEVPY